MKYDLTIRVDLGDYYDPIDSEDGAETSVVIPSLRTLLDAVNWPDPNVVHIASVEER